MFRGILGAAGKDVRLHLPLNIQDGTLRWQDIIIPIQFMTDNEEDNHTMEPQTYGLSLELNLHHGVELWTCWTGWSDSIVPLSDVFHALRNGCDLHIKRSTWMTSHSHEGQEEEVRSSNADYHMLMT